MADHHGSCSSFLPGRSQEHKRPIFPFKTDPAFASLTEKCWAPKADDRPDFDSILNTLLKLRKDLGGLTPKVNIKKPLGGPCGVKPAHQYEIASVAGGTVTADEPLFEYTGGVAANAPQPQPQPLAGGLGLKAARVEKLAPVLEEASVSDSSINMKGIVMEAASEYR